MAIRFLSTALVVLVMAHADPGGACGPDGKIKVTLVVILARNCRPVFLGQRQNDRLVAGTIAVSPDELDELICEGELECGITLAGLNLLRAKGWR